MNLPQGTIPARAVETARRAWSVFVSRTTPWYVKLALAAGLVYVVSPYDIIPDWLPVAGVLDDFALAALLIAWAAGYQKTDDRG